MKQKNLLTTLLLLFALIVGSTSAWAAEEVYKTALFGSDYNANNSSYTGSFDATNETFVVTVAGFNNNNNGWTNNDGNGQIKCGRKNVASTGTITTKAVIDKAITKVVVTVDAFTSGKVNSFKVYAASDADFTEDTQEIEVTIKTGENIFTIETPTEDLFYQVEIDCASGSSNGLVTVSKVEYYYNDGPVKTIKDLTFTGTPTKTVYNSSEDFDPTGLTVTATYDDNSTEDVTTDVVWTPSPLTVSTTSVTGTYMGLTITVNGITVTAAPGSTPETAYTVAEAIAATPSSGTSANVYIKGIVSKFYGSSANIMDDGSNYRYYISDDGTTTSTQLLVYKGKGLNNVTFSSADDLLVGDEVVICGGLMKYGNTPEVAEGNYIVSLTRKELSSIALSGTYAKEFVEGSEFNHDGIVVTATYSDNSTENVTTSATFSEPDMNTVGEQTVTVTYQGKTATYDITITAAPTYTATFSVNGTTSTADFKQNANVDFPAVADVAGMKFMGWTDAEIVVTQATAPESLFTTAVMPNAAKTYYAVFAVEKKGSLTTVVDELTETSLGLSNTNYNDWANKSITSTAVYAGQSADNNGAIQIRSKNSDSGIVSTTSGGRLAKVTVEWYSGTVEGRTLDVYGSNTAYSSASELYSSNTQGSKLGDIVCGTSTELTITDDYAYIGLRSHDGAMYFDKISITWENGTPDTYSEYCTTIASTTATIAINAACTDGDGNYYGTFYTNRAYVMHDDLEGQVVKVDNSGKLTVETAYAGGDVVPANTALLIYALEANNYTVNYTSEDGLDWSSDNMLKGTLTADEETEGANCLFYRLTMHNGTTIGFWWGAEGGAAFKPGANKAYLAVPNSQAQNARGFAFGEEVTGIAELNAHNSEFIINNSDAVYNFAGQRVAQPTKGLYIVNGKKVAVK